MEAMGSTGAVSIVLYVSGTETTTVYADVPDEVVGAIRHALSGEEALAVQSPTFVQVMSIAPEHAQETGACLCTSFSQNLRNDTCLNCGHETHNTRVHCGAIR